MKTSFGMQLPSRVNWKTIDLNLGRLLGNADHIREQKISDLDYIVRMSGRVLVAGVTAALLDVLFLLVVLLNNPQYTQIAGWAYALALYMIADSIYAGQNLAFSVTLGFELALLTPLAIVSVAAGLPTKYILILSWNTFGFYVLGVLVGVQTCSAILRFISGAFSALPDSKSTPTFGQLRKRYPLQTEELNRRKDLSQSLNRLLPLLVLALLALLLMVIHPVLLIVPAFLCVVIYRRMATYEKQYDELISEILARLTAEGQDWKIELMPPSIRRIKKHFKLTDDEAREHRNIVLWFVAWIVFIPPLLLINLMLFTHSPAIALVSLSVCLMGITFVFVYISAGKGMPFRNRVIHRLQAAGNDLSVLWDDVK